MAGSNTGGGAAAGNKYFRWFNSLETLLGTLAAAAIVGCLVVVAVMSITDDTEDGNTADCEAQITAASATDRLAVVGVWPKQSAIGGHICLGVTGVISAEAEANEKKRIAETKAKITRLESDLSGLDKVNNKQAVVKAESDLAAARDQLAAALASERAEPLTLFLNDIPAKGINPGAKPEAEDDTATVNARRTAEFQIIVVELRTSSENGAELWGKVLRGTRVSAEKAPANETWLDGAARNFGAWGTKTVYVGLGRDNASSPEIVTKDSVKIRVYYLPVLAGGIFSLLLFVWCLVLVARNTTLLRDSNLRDTSGAADFEQKMREAALAITVRDKAEAEAANAATEESRLIGSLAGLEKAVTDAKTSLANAAGDAAVEAVAKADIATAEQALTDAKTQIEAARETAKKLRANADRDSQASTEASQEARAAAQAASTGKPIGTFSLARTQIAMWIVLTLAGFLFIWLTTGQYNRLLTPEILVLLGITAASTFTSIQMNKNAVTKETRRSEGFFADIIYDNDGPSLYRLQALAWTLVLAAIFIWGVFWDFSFARFDSNLLLFTGIFQSMYLGFKYQAREPGQ